MSTDEDTTSPKTEPNSEDMTRDKKLEAHNLEVDINNVMWEVGQEAGGT
jgi:hypothetical protein